MSSILWAEVYMTKNKKITIYISIGLLMALIGTCIFCCLIKKLNKVKNTIYGIEYKVLQNEIFSANFNSANSYLSIEMNLQISLRNKTNADFSFNPNVLYLCINGGYDANFTNGTKEICFADILYPDNKLISANNGIYSINTLTQLKLYHPYAELNSCMINDMQSIRFALIYNGEYILEFNPKVSIS